MNFVGKLLRGILERSAKKLTLDDLNTNLQSSGKKIVERFSTAADTPKNRAQANHVIGIERWGQRRLCVLLGEPYLRDEYDGYRPGDDKSMPELRGIFEQVREETIQLLSRIRDGQLEDQTVEHNDFGPMDARTWLYYLESHAARESGRLSKS